MLDCFEAHDGVVRASSVTGARECPAIIFEVFDLRPLELRARQLQRARIPIDGDDPHAALIRQLCGAVADAGRRIEHGRGRPQVRESRCREGVTMLVIGEVSLPLGSARLEALKRHAEGT